MRLWSLHPMYLDSIGLVALWREGLLAQKALAGQTRGYTKHPQLERFRTTGGSIGNYLTEVWAEAARRGYHFEKSKITACATLPFELQVTDTQIQYEFEHLMKKLIVRSPQNAIKRPENIQPHPLFRVSKGEICSWERALD